MNSKKKSLDYVLELVLNGDDSKLESFEESRFRQRRFRCSCNWQGDDKPPIKNKEVPCIPQRKAFIFGRKRVF